MEMEMIFSSISDDTDVVDTYKRPEVTLSIDWLQKNLSKYEPFWQIKAYKLYILWLRQFRYEQSRQYRKFISNFLDEYYQVIHDSINMDLNKINVSEWAFKLSYTLHIFYFLEDTLRIYET